MNKYLPLYKQYNRNCYKYLWTQCYCTKLKFDFINEEKEQEVIVRQSLIERE